MSDRAPPPPAPRWRRGALLLSALGLVALLVALAPVRPLVEWVAHALRDAGWLGWLGFGAVYTVGTVVFVPRAALNVMAGAVFGLVSGTAVAMLGSMLGAWIAFALARTWLVDVAEAVVRRSRLAGALERVMQRYPIRLTTLWHLSLVLPFALLNWAMGAARVRTVDFLTGKAIGVLPATAAYVYLGTLVPSVVAALDGELTGDAAAVRLWTAGIGLAVTVLVMWWIGRVARAALRELTERHTPPSPGAAGSRGAGPDPERAG